MRRSHWFWPIFLLWLLWCIASTWIYTCHLKHACGMQSTSLSTGVRFSMSSAAPKLEHDFAQFQQAIIDGGRMDQSLEIKGLRYGDEVSLPGFDLGTQRAMALANLFTSRLPMERIRTTSQLIDQPAPKADAFAAAEFRWLAFAAPVPLLAYSPPLRFAAGSAVAQTNADFPAMKAALLNNPGRQFEITGVWYESERPADGSDLGLARARAAQALFAADLPAERFVLASILNGTAAPSTDAFEATLFRWVDAQVVSQAAQSAIDRKLSAPNDLPSTASTATNDTTVELIVYFTSNSNHAKLNAETELAIAAFAQQTRGRALLITGHADAKGSAESAQALGLARARALGLLLTNAGFQGPIKYQSAGANEPLQDNQSRAGRQRNRRAQALVQSITE